MHGEKGTALRADGRGAGDIRRLTFVRGYTKYAEGSVLVSAGDTRVLCTATVTPGVPRFLTHFCGTIG